MFEELITKLKELNEIKAIVLGGSRATGYDQEDSDYDVYIYLASPLPITKRKEVIEPFVNYMEYGNQFWELEDDGVLNNGIEIELIYRNIVEFEKMISPIRVNHGYTTCFVDNILSSKILYEQDFYFSDLKERVSDVLNEQLITKIIDYNFPIINKKIPSLYNQFKKAVQRKDIHSMNHRLTEYFSIYHDIIFAINKEYHKGEKRLLELTNDFQYLPKNHRTIIPEIFYNTYTNSDKAVKLLKQLSQELEELLIDLNYIKKAS